MPQPRMSRDGFLAMARRAGLSLTPRQEDELYAALHYIEAMGDRVRGATPRPVEAEPATIFAPGRSAS
jgi:hypothetical protein